MSSEKTYRTFFRGAVFWAVLFAAGVAAGALFPNAFRRFVDETMRVGSALVGSTANSLPLWFAAGIFVKNCIVASVLMLAGRHSRGIFPAAVCFLNGVLVGTVGCILHRNLGLSPWSFAIALAPHGSAELPAVFLSAAVGMSPLTVREKARLAWLPVAMLAAAAVLETWISPLVASRVLPTI
ncbi:MAG: stage II sporulation protein M [Moorellaceae bacterium]